MTDLIGPSPEEMKPGELYRVIEGNERRGYKLEKVEGKGNLVVVDLPPNIAYLLRIYAFILEDTLEGMILQELEQSVENWKDGYVLGEEIGKNYREQFKPEAEKQD